MGHNRAYDWIEKSLATIEKAGWHRSVKPINSRPGAVIDLDGQSLINLASNDYLGLAGDERLIQAATEAIYRYGTGSTGSSPAPSAVRTRDRATQTNRRCPSV